MAKKADAFSAKRGSLRSAPRSSALGGRFDARSAQSVFPMCTPSEKRFDLLPPPAGGGTLRGFFCVLSAGTGYCWSLRCFWCSIYLLLLIPVPVAHGLDVRQGCRRVDTGAQANRPPDLCGGRWPPAGPGSDRRGAPRGRPPERDPAGAPAAGRSPGSTPPSPGRHRGRRRPGRRGKGGGSAGGGSWPARTAGGCGRGAAPPPRGSRRPPGRRSECRRCGQSPGRRSRPGPGCR